MYIRLIGQNNMGISICVIQSDTREIVYSRHDQFFYISVETGRLYNALISDLPDGCSRPHGRSADRNTVVEVICKIRTDPGSLRNNFSAGSLHHIGQTYDQ